MRLCDPSAFGFSALTGVADIASGSTESANYTVYHCSIRVPSVNVTCRYQPADAAHLVVVLPHLLCRRLEGVLNGPAAAGHGYQRLQTAALRGEYHVGVLVVWIRQAASEE